MDNMLYVAMSGASNLERATAIHANNLANVGTHGFRADLAEADAIQLVGDGFPARVYSITESPASDLSEAALIQTGRSLDVAVEGPGFIAVQREDGTEAFTRAGDLYVDALGRLRTGSGFEVLGTGGPVALPPYVNLTIGADGTITVQPQGQGAEALAAVDQIKLVNPGSADIHKDPSGLFVRRDGLIEPVALDVKVTSGFLEGSNVSAVHELTEVLGLSRQFELVVRLMREAEENGESVDSLLQVS